MHLSEHQIRGYVNQVSPAELLVTDEHLALCQACRERLKVVLQASMGGHLAVTSIFEELTAIGETLPAHLSYEQMADYLDDQLNEIDLEILNSHLEACQSCLTEINNLQAFGKMLQPQPETLPKRKNQFLPDNLLPDIQPINWWMMIADRWNLSAGKLLIPIVAAAGIATCNIGLYYKNQRLAALPDQEKQAKEIVISSPPQISSEPVNSTLPVPSPKIVSKQIPDAKIPANLTVEERIINTALATGKIALPPDIKGLRPASGYLMSGEKEGKSFALNFPMGLVVESTQPQFSWKTLPAAKSYVVTISDANFAEVAHSPALTETSWTPTVALERGKIYQWQVNVTTSEGKEITAPLPSAPEAKFKIIDTDNLKLLNLARQKYPASHLKLGVIYAHVGLLDKAEQELNLAAPTAKIAHQLLHNLDKK